MSINDGLRELVRLHGGDTTVCPELAPLTTQWVEELEAFTLADLEALPPRE